MADFDVAIVGAGIAGAALAHHLAGDGRVLLLEREPQPGMHSTGRSAAMFMESYGSPQGRALTRASRTFYAAPPDGFADAPLMAPRGVLYAAWQGQQALLAKTEQALRASGVELHRMDAATCLQRVPVLRPEGLIGALAEPQAMDIDVHALHQGFLRSARRAGVALWCDAALATATRDAVGWSLRLADGRTARAGVLVNAAGAWADDVAVMAGAAPLGLQPKRRSAFTFDAPAGVHHRDWPTVVGVDEGWYFKPDAGQLLGSPANADPVPPQDVMPEELDIATAIHRLQERTTLAIRRPRRTWAGLRTFAPDDEMVIGFDPRRTGLFWLAGQGGWGIQSADGAARLAASLLLGRALPAALADARVDPRACSPKRLL